MWATLAKDTEEIKEGLQLEKSNDEVEVIKFKKPQLARHLKPLYIKTYIDGKSINQVLIDGGAIMNVMPVGILRKLSKTQNYHKETNMKMTNLIGESTEVLGFYIAELIVESKTSSTVFFVVDAKPGYSLLL